MKRAGFGSGQFEGLAVRRPKQAIRTAGRLRNPRYLQTETNSTNQNSGSANDRLHVSESGGARQLCLRLSWIE